MVLLVVFGSDGSIWFCSDQNIRNQSALKDLLVRSKIDLLLPSWSRLSLGQRFWSGSAVLETF